MKNFFMFFSILLVKREVFMKHFAVGLVAMCMMLGIFPTHAANESAAADYQKVPILMVHGLGGNSTNWNTMISRLKSNGYDARLLYTINMENNNTLCAASHLTQISNKVEEIVSESGFERIDVIGHSRGGLNLYDYMRFGNGPNRVRNWISLGGVNNMRCSFNGNPPADDTPGDQTLYTSIYSLSDELATPSLAMIEGANNVAVDNVSHFTLQLDTVVFSHVLDALEGAGLNNGAGISASPSAPTNLTIQ